MKRMWLLIAMLSLAALGAKSALAEGEDGFPIPLGGAVPKFVYGVRVDPPFTLTWDDTHVYLNGVQCLPIPHPTEVEVSPEAREIHAVLVAAQEAAAQAETLEEENAARKAVFDASPLIARTWVDSSGHLQIEWIPELKYGPRLARARGVDGPRKPTPPDPDRHPLEDDLLALFSNLLEDQLVIFTGSGKHVPSTRHVDAAVQQIETTLETGEIAEGPLREELLQEIVDATGR